ncbi:unnamed protein product, partial [Symbiodinium sp. KB8]
MALRMQSAEDTAVRWRVTSSIALVILLRLAGCEPLHGLKSWFCMDLQALDQMQFVFALPSEDVAAQATRAVFLARGLLVLDIFASSLANSLREVAGASAPRISELAGSWRRTFTRRALAGFRCSSPESFWEGFTASAKDWRRMQQTATDAVDLFTAPLSWDALATDEDKQSTEELFAEDGVFGIGLQDAVLKLQDAGYLHSLPKMLGRSFRADQLYGALRMYTETDAGKDLSRKLRLEKQAPSLWISHRSHSGELRIRDRENHSILHVRVLGAVQRGSNRLVLRLLPPKLAKPPVESTDEVLQSGLFSRLKAGSTVYSDGATAYPAAVKRMPRKKFRTRHVAHVRSESTKKVLAGRALAGLDAGQ